MLKTKSKPSLGRKILATSVTRIIRKQNKYRNCYTAFGITHDNDVQMEIASRERLREAISIWGV